MKSNIEAENPFHNLPLVSIIIPVYNSNSTLSKCLESIMAQTYPNIEMIIIDDGSSDGSELIAQKYCNIDERFHLIRQQNKGVSEARNKGIEVAKGEYITFVDSDDVIYNTNIDKYISVISNSKTDLIVSGVEIEYVDGTREQLLPPLRGDVNEEIWEYIALDSKIFGYSVNKLFKKDIIDSYSLRYSNRLYSQEDLDFCLRYINNCEIITLLDEALYLYQYIPNKRDPDPLTYINNQLLILKYSKQKNLNLTNLAYNTVSDRIKINFLYYLQIAYKNDSIKDIVENHKLKRDLLPILFNGKQDYYRKLIYYAYKYEKPIIIGILIKFRECLKDIINYVK